MSFEETFNENLSLRKALNLVKLGLDKTQADYAHLKELFEQLTRNHEKLTNDYERVQKHNHQIQSEKQEVERFLESRVEELKQLVEQKQRELEEIQIKIIPSLDQDMIRVKLIGEMEGPYQEAMNKKDLQLAQTQKRLNECQRKLSLTELELDHTKQQRDQELHELKLYHENEINRLNTRLGTLLSNNEGREKDRQLVRKLRKDVEEARALLQLKIDECDELRREKDSLREEISQLIVRLSTKSNSDTSEKALFKVELHKLQEQIKSRDMELERLTRQIGKEKDNNRQLIRKGEDMESEVERLKNQESHKLRAIKELEQKVKRSGDDRDELKTAVSRLQRDVDSINGKLHEKEQECTRLKQRLVTYEKENNSHEYNYNDRMEEFEEKKAANTKWLKQEAQLNQTIADLRRENRLLKDQIEEINHGNSRTHDPRTSPEPRNPSPEGGTIKQPNNERIRILEEKVKILKKKLQEANTKIVQLLKEKISQQPDPISLTADISLSKEVYEARDAALVPLIAPNDIDLQVAALRMGGLPTPVPILDNRALPPLMPMHPVPVRLPRRLSPNYRDELIYRPY